MSSPLVWPPPAWPGLPLPGGYSPATLKCQSASLPSGHPLALSPAFLRTLPFRSQEGLRPFQLSGLEAHSPCMGVLFLLLVSLASCLYFGFQLDLLTRAVGVYRVSPARSGLAPAGPAHLSDDTHPALAGRLCSLTFIRAVKQRPALCFVLLYFSGLLSNCCIVSGTYLAHALIVE